jgi:hypothetical protein
MAKDDTAKADKAKKEKKPKGEGKSGKGKAGEAPPYSSIATHPRALASVRRAKSWTGIIAFAIAAGLSLKAGVPFSETFLRALGAGIAGYMLVWWGSLRIWRQLMIAEQRAAADEIDRRRAERASLTDSKAAARG